MNFGYFPSLPTDSVADMALPSASSMWIVFAAFVFIYSIFSFILSYHWRTYAFDTLKIKLLMRLYFTVSFILLIGMTIFLLVYQLW